MQRWYDFSGDIVLQLTPKEAEQLISDLRTITFWLEYGTDEETAIADRLNRLADLIQ
jgi:hypothetical protein